MIPTKEKDTTPKQGEALKSRPSLGALGEKIAQHHLHCQGFQTLATNWRHSRLGEIDLILSDPAKRLLVFVEVKTRKGNACGSPVEAVGLSKQGKIRELAGIYLAKRGDTLFPTKEPWDIRFDIIGISFPGQGQPALIEHIEDAF